MMRKSIQGEFRPEEIYSRLWGGNERPTSTRRYAEELAVEVNEVDEQLWLAFACCT